LRFYSDIPFPIGHFLPLPIRVIRESCAGATMSSMSTSTLVAISDALADIVTTIGPAVVQVQGARRPASGIAYTADTVITTARALGREDRLHIRTPDDRTLDAELAGWDPATGLAVVRAADLRLAPATQSETTPRVGHLALAIARSWSNAVTASAGIVAVIGGPLRTGRHRIIEQVIRTTAPMHDGFAGGPLVDTTGHVIGVATAAAIRGLGVVVPAGIAWKTAAEVLQHGRPKRGFLGLAGQPVKLPQRQGKDLQREEALVIVGVTSGSPADKAGLLVGDILLDFDGQAVHSPEDLLELLVGDRVGRGVPLRLLRGGSVQDLTVTVGDRSTL
jgi:S1-C subfamily serine protease